MAVKKYSNDHPTFEWAFDGSDAEILIGRKFKRNGDWDVKYRIAIDTLDHGVQFFNEFVSYENLKNDYLIWNDLLNKYEPCTKVG